MSLIRHGNVLLINPWIYDFAAYNFWMTSYALYNIASILLSLGVNVYIIDCISEGKTSPKPDGRSRLIRENIPKHYKLSDIPRKYARYGMPYNAFIERLNSLKDIQFDFVGVTSGMTYWYPGVFEAIRLVRQILKDPPVVLGGIYATLSYEHAIKYSGADLVVSHDFEGFLTGLGLVPPSRPAYPAFHLMKNLDFVPIFTSKGCPFSCHYCASKYLNSSFVKRDPLDVVNEIIFWHENFRVTNFAFYDDALLVDFDRHLGIILDMIISLNLNPCFHIPNAVHVRYLRKDVAQKLRLSGVKNIRLGLESVDSEFHVNFDRKLQLEEFIEGARNLIEAGFLPQELGAYILYGLPDMDYKSAKKTCEFSHKYGIPPYLAEYSPIPHTKLWQRAKEVSRYPIDEDPIFQNNTLLPCITDIDWNEIEELKNYARSLRQSLIGA